MLLKKKGTQGSIDVKSRVRPLVLAKRLTCSSSLLGLCSCQSILSKEYPEKTHSNRTVQEIRPSAHV